MFLSSLIFLGSVAVDAAPSAAPGLLSYFSESNLAGKAIVWVLIACSFAAWTIMIGKYLDLNRIRSLNLSVEHKIKQSKAILSMGLPASQLGLPPYAALVAAAFQAYEKTKSLDLYDANTRLKSLNHIENALQRAVAEQCMVYESKMLFLGTIISGAPFLGLLGTAWGVMDAFGAVSMQATVNLQMLAPGVSGSLLTTVAALLVAIPSVFGYNYLTGKNRSMSIELENFASTLADRMELEMEEQA